MLNTLIYFSIEVFKRKYVYSQLNKVGKFTHNLTLCRILYKLLGLNFIKANFHRVAYTCITFKPDLVVSNVNIL